MYGRSACSMPRERLEKKHPPRLRPTRRAQRVRSAARGGRWAGAHLHDTPTSAAFSVRP